MHVAVASDHAGFSLKKKVVEYLGGLGHTVEDLGTCDTTPVDYPDFAEAVAAAILSERVERAVLICGSGVGASVAANKFRGNSRRPVPRHVLGAPGVEHDHMNVLVLGGRVIGEELAHELVGAFVGAKQSRGGASPEKAAKIDAIEERCGLELLNEGPRPS